MVEGIALGDEDGLDRWILAAVVIGPFYLQSIVSRSFKVNASKVKGER
jgi:hypothetical protein